LRDGSPDLRRTSGLGVLLGWYRPLEAYLNPLLQLLRQTNPVSLFPAFILFFGIGYATNVAIIYWVVVWPILLGTVNGVKQADPALVKYARSVGLPDWLIFTKVVLPSAVPSIITGMRLAATYSFLMLVVSEMVGASSGLGYLIVNAQYLLSVHLLYVGVIVLALWESRATGRSSRSNGASAHGAPISILESFDAETGRRRTILPPTVRRRRSWACYR
jgi:ABC-type nitrate/sulfonate/bicarbonate transport system permease component